MRPTLEPRTLSGARPGFAAVEHDPEAAAAGPAALIRWTRVAVRAGEPDRSQVADEVGGGRVLIRLDPDTATTP